MHIIFRVDASKKIGSGHVMRCVTLAEMICRYKNVTVEFISRAHSGNMNDLIRQRGFKVHILKEPEKLVENKRLEGYDQWLGVTQEYDAEETIHIISDSKIDWIVVDHYALDNVWENKLRPYVSNIMVIDDLANRRHNCDLLLDQNYIHDNNRYNRLLSSDTIRLLGPKYVLLRKEFVQNNINRRQNKTTKRVFLFFGSVDQDNLTKLALKALTQPKLKHLLVDVVIGSANPHQSELAKEVKKHPNMKLYVQIDNIAKLMSKADLSLGAGGATTWERMAIGLPSIVITIADNQLAFTKDLDKDGYINWIGNVDQQNEQTIYNALLKAINNNNQLQEQSLKCKELVNVKGVEIVTKLLTIGPDPEMLSVRRAKVTDATRYWYWVNGSVVRKDTFNENNIEWQDHQERFNDELNDPCAVLLIIEFDLGFIGHVRFERTGSHYTADYSLVNQFQGLGLEKRVLSKAIDYLRRANAFTLIDEGIEKNTATNKVFQNLGFYESTSPSPEKDKSLPITILSDESTWMVPWIGQLLAEWLEEGYPISWVHKPSEIPKGAFCFILSCSNLVKSDILNRNNHNLVVHESELPKGKGWSPLSWQVLDGKNNIPITLLKAEEEVDSGEIYLQEYIALKGTELVRELREKQALATLSLCRKFINQYPLIMTGAEVQCGKSSYYPKRTPSDSMIDINKTIAEQFNLLRIVDNERYPAYFNIFGQRYFLRIEKEV